MAAVLPKFDIPTIIFGASITHTAFDDDSPSVAAVVASMDKYAARYAGATRVQDSHINVVSGLAVLAESMLKKFFHSTGGVKPSRIVSSCEF